MNPAGVVFVLVPSVSAVEHFLMTRTVTPLVRGSFERNAVLLLSLVVAAAAAAQVHLLGPHTAPAAPVLCGAAPWAAGELLSGRSRHHAASLCASLAAAFGVSWLAWWIVRPSLALQLCAGSSVAALAYLRVRGPAEATPAR